MPAENSSWKWDVTIYDRPGWSGRFRGRARTLSPDGRRIFVRFEQVERATHYGDQFMGRHLDTCLESPDGGLSWKLTADAPPMDGVALPDGSRLVVDHACASRRGEAMRAYLEAAGVPFLWHPEAFAWWDVASVDRRADLERLGLFIKECRTPAGTFLAYLREMRVGVCPPGGTAWTWRPLEGLPPMAHLTGWWRQRAVALDSQTVVGCTTGRVKPDEPQNSAFALRTTDGGQSWQVIPIARIQGSQGFNETFMHLLPDGRILAMIRSSPPDCHLYRSLSTDGGLTWTTPERTPIWGFPAHIIPLVDTGPVRDRHPQTSQASAGNGAILCTYAHRRYPFGVRAAISRDAGATWEMATEKVIRDDGVGAVGYPTSVQLADGTVFTAYELGKAAGEGQRPQSYIAGSRYTPDYATPLGRGG